MARRALPLAAARTLVLLASALLGGSCSGRTPGFSAVGGSSAGGAAAGAAGGAGGSASAQAAGRSASAGSDASAGDAGSAGDSGGDAGQASGGAEPSAGGASSAGAAGSMPTAGGGNAGNAGTAGAGSSDDCKLGSFQDHAYAFCGVVASADAARSKCLALGMDMVGIESAGENAFVLANMSGNSWLGGSDQDEQQRWRWLGSGMLFWDEGPLLGAYQDFMPGNPNNNGANQTNEDCLVTFGERPDDSGHWNDLACDFEFYCAACESP